MSGVEIGPLMLSGERAAVLAGILVFLVATGIFGRRRGVEFARWSTLVILVGALAARITFVALHWESFAEDPLSILAFWQGGFTWQAGVVAAALVTGLHLWRHRRDAVPVLVSLGLSLTAWNVAYQMVQVTETPNLPEETMALLSGGAIELAERNGRPLVINLWATWCPPCRREMPMMVELAGQQEKVDVVFANQGEGPDKIRQFLETEALRPKLVAVDFGQTLSRHFGAFGMPTTLFITPDGRVAHTHLGEISRAAFKSQLEELARAHGAVAPEQAE